MDMCIVGVLVAFLVGLVLDEDAFARAIFSILKGSKDKDEGA